MVKQDKLFGVRISREHYAKLRRLASASERSMAGVIRLLIQQAESDHLGGLYLASRDQQEARRLQEEDHICQRH